MEHTRINKGIEMKKKKKKDKIKLKSRNICGHIQKVIYRKVTLLQSKNNNIMSKYCNDICEKLIIH